MGKKESFCIFQEKMKKLLFYLFIFFLFASCSSKTNNKGDEEFVSQKYDTELNALKTFNEKLSFLNKKVEEQPNNYWLYLQKGLLYDDNRKEEEASIYFRKSLELNPKDYLSAYRLGILLFLRKNYKEANFQFESCVKYADKSSFEYKEALKVKASCNTTLKKFAVAVQDYTEIIDRFGDDSLMTNRHKRGIMYSAMKDYKKAVDDLSQVYANDSTDMYLNLSLAENMLSAGYLQESILFINGQLAKLLGNGDEVDKIALEFFFLRMLLFYELKDYESSCADAQVLKSVNYPGLTEEYLKNCS